MLYRTALLASGFVLALSSGATYAQQSGQSAPASDGKMVTLQMPAIPDPVRVTVDPKTTALLLLDVIDPTCASQPKCTGGMLPAMTPFLARARQAGAVVAYGTREQSMSKWLPAVAPVAGDIKVPSQGQDRFYNTDFDKELKAKGITTIIMAGWKVSGSVAYTSIGATIRGYTVVVPVDATTAATDYETTIGFYQILNQSNGNLANEPLKPKAPTLSRTDMITFK